jgi:hypothetical protein
MFELFQVTAQYSNAVLVAIMPFVSDFAKRLDLPISQPVTVSQVRHFGCSPRSDHIGGRVVLNNGHEFSFDRGRVMLYRSPGSYYSLQDPDRIPEFYGTVKIGKKEALRIAHETIRRLGYTDAMLHADRTAEVTEPLEFGKNVVPRFRVRWLKPDASRGESRGTSIDLEVDASNGQIQMVSLLNTNTWRANPKVDIRPPVVGKGPQTTYSGGRKIGSVSEAYSNAFLVAILPHLSEYARNIGHSVRLPISTNDVDISRYICGFVDNDPMAVVYLKDGTRFNFNHGQVTAFYGSDAFRIPGDKENQVEEFYGKVNLSANEATAVVRKAVKRLGYSVELLHLNEPPQMVPPRKYGTNTFARYFLIWQEPDQGQFRASAEVDATTKKVKSLYINDRVSTNIWRKPPRIDVPQ